MAGKRPNGRKKGQESRSFPALQGYKFLKNGSKRPTGAAARKLLEADQLKTPNRRRAPHITISQAPQPTSYLLSLSMNCSEKIASSAYTTVCMISAVQLRTRLCQLWS